MKTSTLFPVFITLVKRNNEKEWDSLKNIFRSYNASIIQKETRSKFNIYVCKTILAPTNNT